MKLKTCLVVAMSLLCINAAFAADKPLRLILVGDSTMATHNGYGDALCDRLKPEVACINLARNGRSSGSFRAELRWDTVLKLLREGQGSRATLVLIQFGHNDQPGKPGRSTDLATEYPANLKRYVEEARALGGLPVLVTPLTRRTFKDGKLDNDLAPWAEAVRRVAADTRTPLLDLNAKSYAAVQAMGQDEADTLAVVPKPSAETVKAMAAAGTKSQFDRTHLGPKGATLFSAIVKEELLRLMPELKQAFR
ncbi:MAG TPA: rhamnogalacturonan acetylesterase [Burkholderiaceae bacterium]